VKMRRLLVSMMSVSVAAAALIGCDDSKERAIQANPVDSKKMNSPFEISIVITQVGEIPQKDNAVELLLEQYTNTQLDFQWIPSAAYEDKINVMMASGDLPKLLKVEYTPSVVSALQSNVFWEIGPYLKNYKNLAAQDSKFYENISVDGKVYGVPLFRPIGRGVILYRQDWFDKLGLKVPSSLDAWYEAARQLARKDPDQNGKDDTYGLLLDKKFNAGADATMTRLAVSVGAPNKWDVDSEGNFTPEFLTQPYYDTMLLMRKLYSEKLINQDFAVIDSSELEKLYDTGRAGLRISGGSPQTFQDRLAMNDPNGIVNVAPLMGEKGIRVPGESGNAGFLVIAKSAVPTENELFRVLQFLDQLMEPEASMVLQRGIKDRHYIDNGMEVEHLNKEANQREVKPYRDNLPYVTDYNVKPLKGQPLAVKNTAIVTKEYPKFIVANPALVLSSQTNTERGRELEQMIADAQTRFIMGKLDEAGWRNEVDKWKNAGGNKLMEEYKAAYLRTKSL
jgi:putative aldouronate transport system substrate-binding protein